MFFWIASQAVTVKHQINWSEWGVISGSVAIVGGIVLTVIKLWIRDLNREQTAPQLEAVATEAKETFRELREDVRETFRELRTVLTDLQERQSDTEQAVSYLQGHSDAQKGIKK